MVDLAKLVVSLEAQNTQLLTKLEQSQKATEAWRRKTERAVKGVASGFKTILGAGLISAGIRSIVKATAESEAAIAQLETALKSTGGTVGFTSKQMQDFAKEMQRASTFSDEAVLDLETRLLSFSNVTGDVFKRATQATLDLSTRLGKDLGGAALQVGKALNDPIKGLAGLAKAGIQFDASQKLLIKTLAESGHIAEAQGIILGALETKFGGAAVAARDTLGGAIKALNNAFGELLESSNGPGAATDAINDFTKALEDPATVAAANSLASGVIKAFGAIIRPITFAINKTHEFGEALSRAFNGAAVDDLQGLNKQLDAQRALLVELESGYSTLGSEAMGGINAQTVASDAAIKKVRDDIASTEKLIQVTMQLRRERLLADDATGGGAGPTLERKSPAASVAVFNAASKELDAILAKEATKQEAFIDKINALKLDAMTSEARSVEELRQKYGLLNEAIQRGLITAQEAAEVRDGLARQAVESLRLDSLTDEQRAVEQLNAKYTELTNLVKAGAISRKEGDEIGARYADQWKQAEQDKITQFAVAAGVITEQEAAVRALNEEFKELQRTVDAGVALPPGMPRLSQDAADQIKSGLQSKFDAKQERNAQEEYSSVSAGLLQQGEYDLSPLEQSLRAQEDMVNASYQKRMDDIMSMTYATEAQQTDLSIRAAQERNDALQQLDVARQQGQLALWGQAFGNLATLMQSENSKLFNIGKAAAIAEAVVNIAQGITEALAMGPIIGPILAATVAAAGGVQIATIASQQPRSYDLGGDIPKGVVALVGEQGPELIGGMQSGAALQRAMQNDPIKVDRAGLITKPTLIEGPAHVTSRLDTARALKDAGEAQGNFAGLFDRGGYIPAGMVGMAGEQGTEIATHTLNQQMDTGRLATQAETRPITVVKNYNVYDTEHVKEVMRSKDGEEIHMNHISRNGRKVRTYTSQ